VDLALVDLALVDLAAGLAAAQGLRRIKPSRSIIQNGDYVTDPRG